LARRGAEEATELEPARAGEFRERSTKMDSLYDFVAGRTLPVAQRAHRPGLRHAQELDGGDAPRVGVHHVVLGRGDALPHGAREQPARDAGARNELAALNPRNKLEKRLAQRAGLALDSMLYEMNRFGQEGLGTSFSSKLANTTMRLSGLNAITDARKRAFGVTMMDAIGRSRAR
jgi:hypothetical protein